SRSFMIRSFVVAALCLTVLTAAARAEVAKPAKLKAIMYVGGGFHDYKKMPALLADKISELASVSIDIKPMNSAEEIAAAFKDPKFGEGYDVIIYDICFGEKWSDGDYDGALRIAA